VSEVQLTTVTVPGRHLGVLVGYAKMRLREELREWGFGIDERNVVLEHTRVEPDEVDPHDFALVGELPDERSFRMQVQVT
jgi:hypothetical protein